MTQSIKTKDWDRERWVIARMVTDADKRKKANVFTRMNERTTWAVETDQNKHKLLSRKGNGSKHCSVPSIINTKKNENKEPRKFEDPLFKNKRCGFVVHLTCLFIVLWVVCQAFDDFASGDGKLFENGMAS